MFKCKYLGGDPRKHWLGDWGSVAGKGQKVDRVPYTRLPLCITEAHACWGNWGRLGRTHFSELAHPRSEGAGVFILQLPLVTSSRLLQMGLLTPLRLPPAHGQAMLSKAGACDQSVFSGQEMLVVVPWRRAVCMEGVRVRVMGRVPTVSATGAFLFLFLSE